MSIIKNGKTYGVETKIINPDCTIVCDNNGDPIYIKAKSTVTNVNIPNCSTLVELDLSDADISLVQLNVNIFISNCSALSKITWPTKMTYFYFNSGALSGTDNIHTIPSNVNGEYNLWYNNGIYEFVVKNSDASVNIQSSKVMKITKGWEGDEKCNIEMSNATYLVSVDDNSFNYLGTDGCTNLIGSYTDGTFSDCYMIDGLTYSTQMENCGNNDYTLTTIKLNYTWEDGASIISNSFHNCFNLEEVYITNADNGVPTLADSSAFKVNQNGTMIVPYDLKIYVPSDLLEAYKSNDSWADFKDHFYAISE